MKLDRERVRRLWREEGLGVFFPPALQAPPRSATRRAGRLHAERPDLAWAFDFQFHVAEHGREVEPALRHRRRVALAMEAEQGIDHDRVVEVLDWIKSVGNAASPRSYVANDGPEMTAVHDHLGRLRRRLPSTVGWHRP